MSQRRKKTQKNRCMVKASCERNKVVSISHPYLWRRQRARLLWNPLWSNENQPKNKRDPLSLAWSPQAKGWEKNGIYIWSADAQKNLCSDCSTGPIGYIKPVFNLIFNTHNLASSSCHSPDNLGLSSWAVLSKLQTFKRRQLKTLQLKSGNADSEKSLWCWNHRSKQQEQH